MQTNKRPIVCATPGDAQYFFGYYDKFCENLSGRYLLAHAVPFMDRHPNPGDSAEIGFVDLHEHFRWHAIAETRAWNWQQGSMLEWWGYEPERHIVHNDFRGGKFVAVIREIETSQERVLPLPVAAISRDGKQALSLNFARLIGIRDGYGYVSAPDPWRSVNVPEDDGIYWMDMMAGDYRLIITLRQLADIEPEASMRDVKHFVNHIQFSTDGQRFLFLHRWLDSHGKGWHTRMLTAAPDGSDVYLLNGHDMTSHYDWKDGTHILAYARRKGIGDRYFLFTDKTQEIKIVGDSVLPRQDGHCHWSPDRRWFVTDTYPQGEKRERLLLLYNPGTGARADIGAFASLAVTESDLRCDLHPRWSRDGKSISFDSTHEGKRSVYTMDVADIVSE